ncbi:MAG: hypothetical protein ACLF0P_01815 [Thermoanaerobaculia bacterium]
MRTREKVKPPTPVQALVVLITLVVPLRASDQGVEVCSQAFHAEWWEECAHAILEGERRAPKGEDRWRPMERWTPESRFSTEFTAECVHLREAAATEGRSVVESGWSVTPHDASECPCTVLEHQEWVERECVARIDQVLAGMRRWEVMDLFELDGGVHELGTNRLRHPKCPMLKIDVEYDMPNGGFDRSPRDLVVGVSAPYLEHLSSD